MKGNENMVKVLLVSGISGNGGTQTWTREYLKSYDSDRFKLVHVNMSARRGLIPEASLLKRIFDGLLDLRDVYVDVRTALRSHDIRIMHAATSGSLGTLRDYLLAKVAKRFKVKCVLHCHYGCIAEDLSKGGLLSKLLKSAIKLYDEVWVLDTKSKNFLNSMPEYSGKVYVAPNFIETPRSLAIEPKLYTRVAFVGNIVPTKGVFELIEAIKDLPNTQLLLVGPAEKDVQKHINSLINGIESTRVQMLGRLPNEEAVSLMSNVDIVALPTYYPWEAFPISILEAMSRGALVLSCARSAIPDMLTSIDGTLCGIIVPPQSSQAIKDAIIWCQENSHLADQLREKAYTKVSHCYTKEIVFNKYTSLYSLLID